MKKTLFLLVLIGLTGCETPEEENMRLARERSADISKCESYGFTAGTDSMATCMMQQDGNRQTQKAASDAAMNESMRRTAAEMDRQREAERQRLMQKPRNTNCLTYPGGIVRCNSY